MTGLAPNARADDLPAVVPFGDAAVLITLSDAASIESAARAQTVAARIRAAIGGRSGWGSVVPAAASILVHVDPTDPGVDAALPVLAKIAARREPGDETWPEDGPVVEIPVRYGGQDGPDLSAVAEATGLSAEGVIELHAATVYRALFLGFAPGFAYLGPLPAALVLPRRASPRVRVPAGSVSIAGAHTAIYPIESPGGWHVLGRTSIVLWNPRAVSPARLTPGDRVRFVPEAR